MRNKITCNISVLYLNHIFHILDIGVFNIIKGVLNVNEPYLNTFLGII